MSTATVNGTTTANPFAGKTTKATGSYDIPPAGNHPARLVLIHDLGTHDGDYQGKAKEDRKLFLAWELSAELKPNGSPFVIGREYTVLVEKDGSFLYAAQSNIRKMMETWRGEKYGPGEPVDLMKLLGRACLVGVSHTTSGDKTYANLASISGLPKGMQVPAQHIDSVAWHISMGEPPDLEWFPWSYGQSLADIVADSKEVKGLPIGVKARVQDTPYSEASSAKAGPAGPPEDDDSDIPF